MNKLQKAKQIDIKTLINTGNKKYFHCPLCNSKDRTSLKARIENNKFYCFTCASRGLDTIDLYSKLHTTSTGEAVDLLIGGNLKEYKAPLKEDIIKEHLMKKEADLKKLNTILKNSRTATNSNKYLLSRNIKDIESILKDNADRLSIYQNSYNFKDSTIFFFIGQNSLIQRFNNKYENTPKVMNTGSVRAINLICSDAPANEYVIVEGIFTALSVLQDLKQNVICLNSVSNINSFLKGISKHKEFYKDKTFHTLLDMDKAGEEATRTIKQSLNELGIKCISHRANADMEAMSDKGIYVNDFNDYSIERAKISKLESEYREYNRGSLKSLTLEGDISFNINKFFIDKYINTEILKDCFNYRSSFIEAPTGSGKTYSIIKTARELKARNVLLLVPTIILAEQIQEEYGVKYISSDTTIVPYGEKILVCVYDSARNTINKAKWRMSETTIILDECHKVVTDSGFRGEALKDIMILKDEVKSCIEMTATATPIEYKLSNYDYRAIIEFNNRPNNFDNCYFNICKNSVKTEIINRILKSNEECKKSLVFINNIKDINNISDMLISKGLKPCIFDAGAKKEQHFKDAIKGELKGYDVYLTTSVLEEGLSLNNTNTDFIYLFERGKSTFVQLTQASARLRIKGNNNCYIYMKKIAGTEEEIIEQEDLMEKEMAELMAITENLDDNELLKTANNSVVNMTAKCKKEFIQAFSQYAFYDEETSLFTIDDRKIQNEILKIWAKVMTLLGGEELLKRIKQSVKADNVQIIDSEYQNKDTEKELKEVKIVNDKNIEDKKDNFIEYVKNLYAEEEEALMELFVDSKLSKHTKPIICDELKKELVNWASDNDIKKDIFKLLKVEDPQNLFITYEKLRAEEKSLSEYVKEKQYIKNNEAMKSVKGISKSTKLNTEYFKVRKVIEGNEDFKQKKLTKDALIKAGLIIAGTKRSVNRCKNEKTGKIKLTDKVKQSIIKELSYIYNIRDNTENKLVIDSLKS